MRIVLLTGYVVRIVVVMLIIVVAVLGVEVRIVLRHMVEILPRGASFASIGRRQRIERTLETVGVVAAKRKIRFEISKVLIGRTNFLF